MRRVLGAVALAAFAATGVVAQAGTGNTFCERYTQALFGSMPGGSAPNGLNATYQQNLVSAVVTRAFVGTSGVAVGGVNVTGLYYEQNNAKYFNGNAGLSPALPDYLNPANSAAFTTLFNHLVQFFMFGLQCRQGAITNPWASVNLNSVHARMGINLATENAFIAQVAGSLLSFGVPNVSNPPKASDDLVYIVALMKIFNRYAGSTATSAPFSICQASDCAAANGFAEFDASSSGAFSTIFPAATGNTVTINQGDSVHFNLGAADSLQPTATATGTTPLAGGTPSDAGARSWTITYPTAGTYYYYNGGSTANHATVIVSAPAASSTGGSMASTGGSMASTGGSMASTASMASTGGSMASTGARTSTGTTPTPSGATATAAGAIVAVATLVAALAL